MTKVKCGVIRDLLPLVTDDVATADSKELVEEHLQECGYCRGYLEGMTAQLAKLPEEPPADTSFIRFCRRMEKRFRLRKLLIGLLIVAVALLTLGGAAAIIKYKTNVQWRDMPIEWAEATVYREANGEIGVAVGAVEGHRWYGLISMMRMDDVLYISPCMPAWRLFARGYDSSFVTSYDLRWEEGGVVQIENEYDVVYDEESGSYVDQWTPTRFPICYIRWGTPDNFTTIYAEGDEIPYFAEVQLWMDELDILADNMTIYHHCTPEPISTSAVGGQEDSVPVGQESAETAGSERTPAPVEQEDADVPTATDAPSATEAPEASAAPEGN